MRSRGVLRMRLQLAPEDEHVSVNRSEVGNVGRHLARIGLELDRFLEARAGDPVARREAWTAALRRNLPEQGVGAQAVIDEIAETLIPNGARLAEGGFSAWVTTGPDTVPVVASAAASLASPQRYMITAFNLVEELSLEWLAEMCGLGRRMQGVYSSGGSVANLVALGAARQWAFEQAGVDAAADGTAGVEVALYASAEAHHTVQRSAAVLGIGRSRVRTIGTDDEQRMRIDLLRRAMEEDVAAGVLPIAVVATAGTTNTGVIDPLRAAGEVAREHGAWFHIDGAYGAPRRAGRTPHTTVRRARSRGLGDHRPSQVARSTGGNRSHIGARPVDSPSRLHAGACPLSRGRLRGGRRGEGVGGQSRRPVHGLCRRALGAGERSRRLEHHPRARARGRTSQGTARQRLRAPSRRARPGSPEARARHRARALDLLLPLRHPEVEDTDAFNRALFRRLVRETEYLPSTTVVSGRFVIRPCYINARTNEDHVDGLVDAVVTLGDEMLAGGSESWPGSR